MYKYCEERAKAKDEREFSLCNEGPLKSIDTELWLNYHEEGVANLIFVIGGKPVESCLNG